MNEAEIDLGMKAEELSGKEVVAYLDRRIADTIRETERSEIWRTLTSPDTSPQLIAAIMREIYLEIVMYQPDSIEAAIAIIGQMPRNVPPELIEEMLHHQAEEFDHGEMAMRDFCSLGGCEEGARGRRMSPTAFNTAACWWMIAQKRDPFVYLGALYPFEGLTPIITGKIKGFLREKGMDADALGFVEYHSTADLEHTRIVKELIEQIADDYPESRAAICYGINYFLQVYPLPGWNAAYRRARAGIEGRSIAESVNLAVAEATG